MRIHNFAEQNSLLNSFVHEIRSISIQQDSLRFRRNIERIGEILSYELSKTLQFASQDTTTPLGEKTTNLPNQDIVICSILRAGLPLHQGVLNYFDQAESAFISANGKNFKDTDVFEIKVKYEAFPGMKTK